MAYNPYEAVKKITENKRGWANAKAQGRDTSKHESDAVKYYDELRNAGRDDVADYLKKSDSVTAGKYLENFSPDYAHSSDGLQKKSDDLYGVYKSSLDDVKKSYDDVYKNNVNVDPTATGYGKSILNSYGVAADNAFKSALGSGAEANYGNVDSYAAANALRQKSAVVSQGYGDVLNYYNSISDNANDWAKNKSASVADYLAGLSGNVGSDRTALANKNAYDNERYAYDVKKHEADNALSEALAKAEADKYVSDNDYAGTVYKADLDYAGNVYKADRDYSGAVYKADSDRAKSAASNASAEYIQLLKNAGSGSSSGSGKSSYSGVGSGYTASDAGEIVDGIIATHTTDKMGVKSEEGSGSSAKREYSKVGSEYDKDAIKSDLLRILSSDSVPDDVKQQIIYEATVRGYEVSSVPKNMRAGSVSVPSTQANAVGNPFTLRMVGDRYKRLYGNDPEKLFYAITDDATLTEAQKAELLKDVGLGEYVK